ncbi:MAG: ABC transporter permease [Vicinamibacterales bacterium]
MRRVLAYLRSQWHCLRAPAQIDADMNDEMRFHIEMDAQRRMKQGLDAEEARRQAAVAFGGVEKYRGVSRDVLGFTWARGLSVDLKLGLRMLAKCPGLTIVAVFALSLAIGAGAGYLEFVNDLLHGQLPFDQGDRIVGIQNWDQQTGDPENRSTADFVAWRGTLSSFEDLAAYRTLDRNLITDDGRAEPVRGVEISAAAFRIARVPPLIGRPLVPEDERPGAPPVVVLGHDLWTTRFGSSAAVVGQPMRLGRATYTVVGVMPEGFGLPVSHSLWVPLQLNAAHYARREGAATKIFGRLAAGVELSMAQAELNAIALRSAAEFPETDRHIRPIVKPYVESLWSAVEDSRMQTIVLYSANVLFIGLLALCSANIATLVFARTATRDAEISVRTALGASRARIAGQLFAEALVLSAIATLLGLTFAAYALRWVKLTFTAAQGRPMMFWWNDSLSLETLVYACVLAVVAALIIGVTPALKATGPRVQERLKHATGASSAGLKFGGVWTGVIVTQVAVTVIFLAIVGMLGWSAYISNGGERQRNFPVTEYVTVRLTLDRAAAATSADAEKAEAEYRNLFRTTYGELARRLAAEPGVAGMTYAMRLPGMNHQEMQIEVDGAASGTSDKRGPLVRTTEVGVNFVETFQAPMIAGRSFTDSDLAPGRHVAVVDRTFVRQVLGGHDAIGRHVRDAGGDGRPAGPWMEIVGVVRDLTDETNKAIGDSVIYRPASPEAVSPLYLAVHARSNPSAVMSQLRIIASDVDPTLRLIDLQTMDNVGEADRVALDFFARLLAGVSAVALLLATAGVYALMSFTVARCTWEIGIRVALGANPSRIVMSTFSRALAQVGLGLLAGSIPAAILVAGLGLEVSSVAGTEVAVVAWIVATLFVAGVTALASVVPA